MAVIPNGGINNRPRSPYFEKISRSSLVRVCGGKFFTSITVLLLKEFAY